MHTKSLIPLAIRQSPILLPLLSLSTQKRFLIYSHLVTPKEIDNKLQSGS